MPQSQNVNVRINDENDFLSFLSIFFLLCMISVIPKEEHDSFARVIGCLVVCLHVCFVSWFVVDSLFFVFCFLE